MRLLTLPLLNLLQTHILISERIDFVPRISVERMRKDSIVVLICIKSNYSRNSFRYEISFVNYFLTLIWPQNETEFIKKILHRNGGKQVFCCKWAIHQNQVIPGGATRVFTSDAADHETKIFTNFLFADFQSNGKRSLP